MAITYHAGRRLQGLSTDATETTNGTASSGTAVVFDASSEVGSGDGINYSGNVIGVNSGANVAPNYWDVAITATAKLKIPSSGVSEMSVTATMSNGGWSKFGLSSTQTDTTTADQGGLCSYGMNIADDGRAWYWDSTSLGGYTQFTGGAATYKITVDSSGVVKFYKDSSVIHTSSNTASGNYYIMAVPYQYSGSSTYTYTYSGDYVEITTGVKPTNVQVGSRFEETDTRKMYHKTDEYKVHSFTSSGTFAVTGSGDVEYLVVAGGGGSGAGYTTWSGRGGGGGGAGGYLTGTGHGVTAQTYNITVGAGGTANNNGSNSVFSSFTSIGGGRGGQIGGNVSAVGGSGGGGSGGDNGSAGTSGQGNTGANGSGNGSGGGGGGGSNSAGSAGSVPTAGAGGSGTANDILITGSNVTYASGGAGGNSDSSGAGTAGGDNTGNGASGGSGDSGSAGASGGSGIVIIRYLTSSGITATGGTITTTGGAWTEEGT